MNNGAGKGDTPRPADKKKYDENYDRIFQKKCKTCDGWGKYQEGGMFSPFIKCSSCGGTGKRKSY